jgi:hypothetical protein
MKFGALVPEMNLSTPARRFQQHDCLEGTAGRRHVRGARGARPSCHVSYYRCVLILPTPVSACGLQMSCGGSKARLFPIKHSYIHCVNFSAQCRCATISRGQQIMCPTEEDSLKEKLVASPSPTKCFFLLYCGHPAARSNFEAFQIRGGNLGNSHPFRCVRCNSRELLYSNRGAPRSARR